MLHCDGLTSARAALGLGRVKTPELLERIERPTPNCEWQSWGLQGQPQFDGSRRIRFPSVIALLEFLHIQGQSRPFAVVSQHARRSSDSGRLHEKLISDKTNSSAVLSLSTAADRRSPLPQSATSRPMQRSKLRLQTHSIISSARVRSEDGTVSPSAFAVFRLITNSTLAACSTGRSLGLAPRSILSMYSAPRVSVQERS